MKTRELILQRFPTKIRSKKINEGYCNLEVKFEQWSTADNALNLEKVPDLNSIFISESKSS